MRRLGTNFETFVLANPPEDIYKHVLEIFKQCLEDGITASESFNDFFGGDFYLIETEDDLKEIPVHIPHPTEMRWLSVFERADSFDAAEEIGEHTLLLLCTNNAGGNSYFIPKAVSIKNQNVKDCVTLTSAFWAIDDKKGN